MKYILTLVVEVLAVFGVIVGSYELMRWDANRGAEQRVKQNSSAVVVLRTLASGGRVSKEQFDNAFPADAGGGRAIRWASEDLGISYEQIRNMVDPKNYSLVYTGDPNNIPVKLRPTASSESAAESWSTAADHR
jgi:hypothetical protein